MKKIKKTKIVYVPPDWKKSKYPDVYWLREDYYTEHSATPVKLKLTLEEPK